MCIRAVVTDMDGTLIDDASQVSPFTLKVLTELHKRNIPLIIATGRPAPSVMQTMKKCGLQPDYIITINGAVVSDKDGKVLVQHHMKPDVVHQLLALRQKPNVDGSVDPSCPPKQFTTNVNSGPNWYTDLFVEDVQAALGSSIKPHVVDFQHPEEFIHSVDSVWYIGDAEDMPLVQAYVKQKVGAEVNPVLSLPYLCDVISAGVNKGKAVQEVCERLQIPVEEVVGFGDGMNDWEMLQLVGHPHVMENGQQKLKDALPTATVIGRNTEDGVAKRLVELFHLTV